MVNEHNVGYRAITGSLTRRKNASAKPRPEPHLLEGYRRLTFMMLDADQVACSPASTYRVLKAAGLLAGSSPTLHQERHRLRPASYVP